MIHPDVEKIRSEMVALRIEKNKSTTIHVVDEWFPLSQLKAPAYVGAFAITTMDKKVKWVKRRHAHYTDAGIVTPGDIARDYLTVKGYSTRTAMARKLDVLALRDMGHRPPLYAVPGSHGPGVYLDITSAYWSIMQAIGWGVDYKPGVRMVKRCPVNDFPYPEIKMARNSMVSIGLTHKMKVWDGDKMHFTSGSSRFRNYVLYAAVMDILNNFASDMIAAGAVYAYTDGFIVPHASISNTLAVFDDWGLPASVKADGDIVVRRSGAYRVGTKQTRTFSRGREVAIDKVKARDIEWSRRVFSWLRRRINTA